MVWHNELQDGGFVQCGPPTAPPKPVKRRKSTKARNPSKATNNANVLRNRIINEGSTNAGSAGAQTMLANVPGGTIGTTAGYTVPRVAQTAGGQTMALIDGRQAAEGHAAQATPLYAQTADVQAKVLPNPLQAPQSNSVVQLTFDPCYEGQPSTVRLEQHGNKRYVCVSDLHGIPLLPWLDLWIQDYERSHKPIPADTNLWMRTVQMGDKMIIPYLRPPVPSLVWDAHAARYVSVPLPPPDDRLWHACLLGTHGAFGITSAPQMQVPSASPSVRPVAGPGSYADDTDKIASAIHAKPGKANERPRKRVRFADPHQDNETQAISVPASGPIANQEDVPAEDDATLWKNCLANLLRSLGTDQGASIPEESGAALTCSPTKVGEETRVPDDGVTQATSPSDLATLAVQRHD